MDGSGREPGTGLCGRRIDGGGRSSGGSPLERMDYRWYIPVEVLEKHRAWRQGIASPPIEQIVIGGHAISFAKKDGDVG